MASTGARIRKLLKELERQSAVSEEFRDYAKTEGGRLTPFGVAIIHAAIEHEVPQAAIARILDVSPAAVSRRAAEFDD